MHDWEVRYLGKRDRAVGTKTFTFERPSGLAYAPGQFFFISIPSKDGLGTGWMEHHFTFSSSPTEPHVELTTRMTGHEFKDRLDSLEPGTTVKITGPSGEFVLRPGMEKAAYVCGGIGITPARSTVRWALDTGAPFDISVLYANHDLSSAPFEEEFAQIHSERVRVIDVLSEPASDWRGPRGHIDAAVVRTEVADWAERQFFVSGPPKMVAALARVLAEDLGVAKERLTTEDFTGYE